jgi:transposase
MIVLGADMHKRSHTVAAVGASTGEVVGDKTIRVGDCEFAAAIEWAIGLGDDRVWALEDCRHVSGAFERFVLVRGERVVRVATRVMAGERRAGRDRGKSDRIDALAVARAALREGVERLPVAELEGVELDIRLLIDHRERLVRMRTALYDDLLWHLHDLWPEQAFPKCALLSKKWAGTIGRRLARAEQTARVRIARDEFRHLRDLSRTIDALEVEIAELVAEVAPRLLAEPGFGPLTAGKLIGEIAGAQRFSTDAKLARAGGIAPIPVSSGNTNRHRLDRGGNRQINTAVHRVAITRLRCHPETKAYIARKRAEGRPAPRQSEAPPHPPHLAPAPAAPPGPPRHQSLDIGAAKAAARPGQSADPAPGSPGVIRRHVP